MMETIVTTRAGADTRALSMYRQDTRSEHSRAFSMILVLALFISLSSCSIIRPRTSVILNPSVLRPIPGDRPWLFVRYTPYSYRELIVEVRVPEGGGAYLTVGPALSAAYNNALGAFFMVNLASTKGAGQLAFADFDMVDLESSLEDLGTSGTGLMLARVSLRLRHSIRIMLRDGVLLEEIPLDVSARSVIEYSGREDFMAGAGRLAADLFQELEGQLFDHLVGNNYKGKYIYRGGFEPFRDPATMY